MNFGASDEPIRLPIYYFPWEPSIIFCQGSWPYFSYFFFWKKNIFWYIFFDNAVKLRQLAISKWLSGDAPLWLHLSPWSRSCFSFCAPIWCPCTSEVCANWGEVENRNRCHPVNAMGSYTCSQQRLEGGILQAMKAPIDAALFGWRRYSRAALRDATLTLSLLPSTSTRSYRSNLMGVIPTTKGHVGCGWQYFISPEFFPHAGHIAIGSFHTWSL